jgi:hypothetical protein
MPRLDLFEISKSHLSSSRLDSIVAQNPVFDVVPCIVCCRRNKTLKIFHIHLSTSFYNGQMIAEGELVPMCHFCDTEHMVDHLNRQHVILTTSTLSGIQYMEGWGWNEKDGDPLHCDVEAIPGAKIVTPKKAWERAYMRNPPSHGWPE